MLVHHLDCLCVTWTMALSQPELSERLDHKLFGTLARASASFRPFLVSIDQTQIGHIQNWDLSNHSVNALTKAVAGLHPTKVLDKCVCFKCIPVPASQVAVTWSQTDTVGLADDFSWNITLRHLLSFLACVYYPLWIKRHQIKNSFFYMCMSRKLLLFCLHLWTIHNWQFVQDRRLNLLKGTYPTKLMLSW